MVTHIIQALDQVIIKHPGAGIILLGDFNKLPDALIKRNYNLKQIVKNPTHGDSYLDLIYTNMHQFYREPEHLSPIGLSKHQSILCTPLPSYKHQPAKSYKVRVRNYSLQNRTMFSRTLQSIRWEPMYHMDSCEDQYQYFHSNLEFCFNTHFPTKVVERMDSEKPWVTDGFRKLVHRRNVAWKSGNAELYKVLRNKVNRACKGLKSRFYRTKVEQIKSENPKHWW